MIWGLKVLKYKILYKLTLDVSIRWNDWHHFPTSTLLSSTDFLLIISIIKISQTKVKHPTEHHPAGTEGSDQKMSQSDQIRNQSEHWLKYRDRDPAQITHINIDLSYLHQTHLDKSSSQSPVQLFPILTVVYLFKNISNIQQVLLLLLRSYVVSSCHSIVKGYLLFPMIWGSGV